MRKKKCNTCDWRLDSGREFPIFHKDNKDDVRLAKEYCEDHERIYGSLCEPVWCDECGHLRIYSITVTDKSRKMTPKFDRKKK